MRRARLLILSGAVSALVVGTLPAHAGTSGAAFSDPAGDMAVPSLDIVSGAIRLDAGASRTLSMTATMRGDLTGVPADYDLVTGVQRGSTCYSLAVRVRWTGATVQSAYQKVSTFACKGDVTPAALTVLGTEAAQYAVGGEPVTGTAKGQSVGVTLPAPAWLTRDSLAGFAVLSHTPVVGVSTNVGAGWVGNYDLAGIDQGWRVG